MQNNTETKQVRQFKILEELEQNLLDDGWVYSIPLSEIIFHGVVDDHYLDYEEPGVSFPLTKLRVPHHYVKRLSGDAEISVVFLDKDGARLWGTAEECLLCVNVVSCNWRVKFKTRGNIIAVPDSFPIQKVIQTRGRIIHDWIASTTKLISAIVETAGKH